MLHGRKEGTRRKECLGPAAQAPLGGGVGRRRWVWVQRLYARNIHHMALACAKVSKRGILSQPKPSGGGAMRYMLKSLQMQT